VVTPFAGYGFPKAHSAGYALIAYLKAHYPVEFMAALLSSDAQRTDRVMIEIDECDAMGIKVLPPDINDSLRHFTALPKKKSIRFGLTAIKGIGESSVQLIIEQREERGVFKSLEDFARRVPSKILNKKLIEALAKSGAMDSFGERRTLVDHYDRIVEYRRACGEAKGGQGELFEGLDGGIDKALIEFPETPPTALQQKLQWEKETLGLYISSHPLAGLKKYIGKKAQLIGDLTAKDVGKKVTIAGIQEGIRKIKTKKGEVMAIVSLEDPTGKIEVTLFPRTYAGVSDILELPDTVLVIGGTVDFRSGQLQIRADVLKRASLSTMIEHARKEGFFDESETKQRMTIPRKPLDDEESVELIDDEGNVVAGEKMVIHKEEEKEDFLGILGTWIREGMPVEHLIEEMGMKKSSVTEISIHTIGLPDRAPKQLLLELKKVFQTFPGKEKVQLKIGEQLIPLPLTITMSIILEKKVEDVIEKYAALV